MKYLPAAQRDVIEAAEFYEHRSAGLGSRFLAAVEQAVDFAREFPQGSPVLLLPGLPRAVRRRRVGRFPYIVLYVLEPEALVVAVAHTRQGPSGWADRLD